MFRAITDIFDLLSKALDLGEKDIDIEKRERPKQAAKVVKSVLQTTAEKVATGVAVIALASSGTISCGTQTDIPNTSDQTVPVEQQEQPSDSELGAISGTVVAEESVETQTPEPTEQSLPTVPPPAPTNTPSTEQSDNIASDTIGGGSGSKPVSSTGDTLLSPAKTITSTGGGRIAFVSNRDGNDEIYLMNVDGSEVIRLTDTSGSEDSPAWSPDGQQIAFGARRDGEFDIYVMNADGSNVSRLTNDPSYDSYPAWSPDGKQIAFTTQRDGNYEIYVMNSDGSGQTNLTNNPANDLYPTWSPDSTRIIFNGDDGLYVMNADGSGRIQLTDQIDLHASWSPDGTRTAFVSGREGSPEIYLIDHDGNQTNLTNHPGWDWDTTWSPDGQRIAFASDRDGNVEIYAMNTDGSGVTRLTDNPAWDGRPAWSPVTPVQSRDDKIAFLSDRDRKPGSVELYIMNPDGSELTRITTDLGLAGAMANRLDDLEGRLAWSPSHRQFFYSTPSGKLYSINADGSGQTLVTEDIYQFDLSPDGQYIAAYVSEPPTWGDIITMNSDGSDKVVLTNQATRETLGLGPDAAIFGTAWSPDGKSIAFYSVGSLFMMGTDGSNPIRLTPQKGVVVGKFDWSPDGQYIAFYTFDGPDLYLLDVYSGDISKIIEDGLGPAWSPDGTEITFSRKDEQIWLVGVDGTGLTQLTSEGQNCCAIWVNSETLDNISNMSTSESIESETSFPPAPTPVPEPVLSQEASISFEPNKTSFGFGEQVTMCFYLTIPAPAKATIHNPARDVPIIFEWGNLGPDGECISGAMAVERGHNQLILEAFDSNSQVTALAIFEFDVN